MNVLKYIPKRLLPHVLDCYHDSDGYWVHGDDYYFDPSSGSSTTHAESVAELRRMLFDVLIFARIVK